MVMMVCQRQHLTLDRQQQITPADCAKRPRCDLSPRNSRHAAPRTALWEDLVQLSAGGGAESRPLVLGTWSLGAFPGAMPGQAWTRDGWSMPVGTFC